MPPAQHCSHPAVQSVDRALTILSLLARHGGLGVTELAGKLGIHKSTAFRLVATLELHGLVEQHTDRGKYHLGVGTLQLAGATAARLDLVQTSRQVTRHLFTVVGETVNLAVLSGEEALYVDQMSVGARRSPDWVGRHAPLHATSDGKVLLAHMTGSRLGGVYARQLTRFTDRTLVDPHRLRGELDAVRTRGFATAVDELEVGLTAVAAPVRGADGTVIASLSASGPSFRLPADRIADCTVRVVEAAGQISRRLGYPAGATSVRTG